MNPSSQDAVLERRSAQPVRASRADCQIADAHILADREVADPHSPAGGEMADTSSLMDREMVDLHSQADRQIAAAQVMAEARVADGQGVVLRGSLAGLDLDALVASLARLGHRGELVVGRDGRSGTLVLQDGRVVGARFGTERGRAALEAIVLVLSSAESSFSFALRGVPAFDELGLSAEDCRAYLAHLLVERESLRTVVASPAAVARIARAPEPGRGFTLHHSAIRTLLDVDGRRCVEELADGRGLARTMLDLAELARAGLVVVEHPPSPAEPDQAAPRTPHTPRARRPRPPSGPGHGREVLLGIPHPRAAPRPTSPLGLSWYYLVFLAGLTVSKLGDALYTFALPWLALELTGSPLVMGTLYATEVLPVVLFGPLIGVLIDRWDRRRLLLAADLSRAAIVSIIPFLHAMGRLELAHLYIVGFALALISLAFDVGTTAAVPELAGKEQLTRANAAHQLVTQLASTGGPVVAGVLVTAIGASTTLWVDSASYAGTILAVLILPAFSIPHAERTASGVLRGMLEGMRWLWTNRPIRALSLQAMVGNFGFGMIMAVFLYYLSHTLGLSAELSGIDYALLEVGGMLGTLAIVPLDRRVRRGRLYSGIIAWGTLGLVLTLQLRGWWWAPGVGMAIVLSGNLAWTVLSTSVRQELIPAELRGRVLSFTRVLAAGCMPLGATLGGLISQAFDPSLVFVVAIVAKVLELLITRFSSIREL